MIPKLITQYLESNRRLILPTLGAFIKKDDSGEIVFVPYLKSDDGVMKSLIVNSLGLTNADAEAMLEEFVFAMKQGISRQGSFVVEGLGVISQDANGIFTMSYDPNASVAVVEPNESESEVEQIAVNQATTEVVTEPVNVIMETISAESQPIVETPQTPVASVQAQPENNIIDLDVPEQPAEQPAPRTTQSHESQIDALYSTRPMPKATEQPRVRVVNPSSRNDAPTQRAERRPTKPARRRSQRPSRQKIDIFMIVAIIAVIAGLLVLLYGTIFPTPDAIFIG